MTLTAIGNVAALDMTSGGAAVAQANIEINGNNFVWSSPLSQHPRMLGQASSITSSLQPSAFNRGLVPGESFFVAMSIFASNPSAFPANSQNYGTLTVNCIFFD